VAVAWVRITSIIFKRGYCAGKMKMPARRARSEKKNDVMSVVLKNNAAIRIDLMNLIFSQHHASPF
jgi:hypothetical protein